MLRDVEKREVCELVRIGLNEYELRWRPFVSHLNSYATLRHIAVKYRLEQNRMIYVDLASLSLHFFISILCWISSPLFPLPKLAFSHEFIDLSLHTTKSASTWCWWNTNGQTHEHNERQNQQTWQPNWSELHLTTFAWWRAAAAYRCSWCNSNMSLYCCCVALWCSVICARSNTSVNT